MNARRIGLLLCLIASTAAAAVVWVSTGYRHTATVMFRLFREQPSVLPDHNGQSSPDLHERFKATQRQIVMSGVVLNKVLRSPEVANHPTIRAEEDPLTWLREHLSVSFPEDSDLMSVNVTTRDASEAGLLAKAVSEEYLRLTANMEQSQHALLAQSLHHSLDRNRSSLRLLSADLKTLLEQSGLSDNDPVSTVDRFAQDTRENIPSELIHTQLEILSLQAKLGIRRSRYERLSEPESKELDSLVSELDVENAAGSDPLMCELRTRLGKKVEPAEDEPVEPANDGPESELSANVEQEDITKQMDARRAVLRAILQRQVLAELRDELAQIGDELAIQEAIKNRLEENLKKNLTEAAKYANQRMDIDEVKQQITALEDFGRRLHQAILEHDMAIDAPSRIHLVSPGVGDTPVPHSPAISSRLWMSIGAALTAWLLVPVAVILLRFSRLIFRIAFPGALNRQGVAPST